jgi:hypothetical protein
VNGCCDDRGELARRRTVCCAIEKVEDVAGVRGVEATGDAGRREGVVLDEESAGLVAHGRRVGVRICASRSTVLRAGALRSIVLGAAVVRSSDPGSAVRAQLDVQAEALSSFGEQVPVGEADELAGELAACDGEAKLRADAGRFARGERYAGKGCTQSLYST